MSESERLVFKFLQKWDWAKSPPPSLREIAIGAHVGLGVVQRALDMLEARGLVACARNGSGRRMARTIKLAQRDDEFG